MSTKIKRGLYFLQNKEDYFIFNTIMKRGRGFLSTGKVFDVFYDKHPKIVKATLSKGEFINSGIKEEVV